MTVSLAGLTVREQEALQCLLDLPIDRCVDYFQKPIINQGCQLTIEDVICHCRRLLEPIINQELTIENVICHLSTSISYCSADPTYDRVFAVLCTEGDGTACHAFLTHKRKMVSEIQQ